MPLLTTDPPYRSIVHYEVYGKGRPVLFLHGWLGSWTLWRDTIAKVGEQYRTYSIDFWGFGESRSVGTREEAVQEFSVDAYVDMVGQFMDKLGIPKAAVVGHSMGGTVALKCAMQYPDRIVKAVVVGSPINGESLYPGLKIAGNPLMAGLGFTFYPILKNIVGTYLYFSAKDGRIIRDMMLKDLPRVNMQSFFQSIGTLRRTDLTNQLHRISQPVLGIYGKKDIIVQYNQNELVGHIEKAQLALYNDAGHFPMADVPDRFVSDLLSFLDIH